MPNISTSCGKTKRRQFIENKMTIIMIIYSGTCIYYLLLIFYFFNFKIGIFILAWTPYAVVSMYSAFINPDHITPLRATLPAMFAKSSFILSSMFYVCSNKEIFSKVFKVNSVSSHASNNNNIQSLGFSRGNII